VKTTAPRGSHLLGRALDVAASHLNVHVQAQRDYKQKTGEDLPKEFAGIVFSGNPHETVPRRLLLDDRLSPLERNAWPSAYQQMSSEQQQRAQLVILAVPAEIRASLVKQWGVRCASGKVAKPFGYLMKLIQKAQTGDFNSDWQPAAVQTAAPATPTQPTSALTIPRFEPATVQPKAVSDAQTGNDVLKSLRKMMGRGGGE